MTYDAGLAERVLRALAAHESLTPTDVERKAMFGGLAYMVGGAMCVGVMGEELVAKAGAGDEAAYLREPGVRPMDFTGRPMKGWLYVGGVAIATDAALARWVDRCVTFTKAQPPKKKPAAKKPAARVRR